MGTKIAVAAITIAVGVYFFVIGQWAIALIVSEEPVGIVMGIALFLLPVLGAWAVLREIWFGYQANKLGKSLGDVALPGEGLPTSPSGKILREAADADFPRWAENAENNPDDWKSWYLLGLAYSNSGDNKRARASVRKALKLSK